MATLLFWVSGLTAVLAIVFLAQLARSSPVDAGNYGPNGAWTQHGVQAYAVAYLGRAAVVFLVGLLVARILKAGIQLLAFKPENGFESNLPEQDVDKSRLAHLGELLTRGLEAAIKRLEG